jgi:hypothetical protein
MITAEFEEKSYEAPLYNQLERGNPTIFSPGQVLESKLGFDRGLFLAQEALWEILGYKSPLKGAALAYYDWPRGIWPGAASFPASTLPPEPISASKAARLPREEAQIIAEHQGAQRTPLVLPHYTAPAAAPRNSGG